MAADKKAEKVKLTSFLKAVSDCKQLPASLPWALRPTSRVLMRAVTSWVENSQRVCPVRADSLEKDLAMNFDKIKREDTQSVWDYIQKNNLAIFNKLALALGLSLTHEEFLGNPESFLDEIRREQQRRQQPFDYNDIIDNNAKLQTIIQKRIARLQKTLTDNNNPDSVSRNSRTGKIIKKLKESLIKLKNEHERLGKADFEQVKKEFDKNVERAQIFVRCAKDNMDRPRVSSVATTVVSDTSTNTRSSIDDSVRSESERNRTYSFSESNIPNVTTFTQRISLQPKQKKSVIVYDLTQGSPKAQAHPAQEQSIWQKILYQRSSWYLVLAIIAAIVAGLAFLGVIAALTAVAPYLFILPGVFVAAHLVSGRRSPTWSAIFASATGTLAVIASFLLIASLFVPGVNIAVATVAVGVALLSGLAVIASVAAKWLSAKFEQKQFPAAEISPDFLNNTKQKEQITRLKSDLSLYLEQNKTLYNGLDAEDQSALSQDFSDYQDKIEQLSQKAKQVSDTFDVTVQSGSFGEVPTEKRSELAIAIADLQTQTGDLETAKQTLQEKVTEQTRKREQLLAQDTQQLYVDIPSLMETADKQSGQIGDFLSRLPSDRAGIVTQETREQLQKLKQSASLLAEEVRAKKDELSQISSKRDTQIQLLESKGTQLQQLHMQPLLSRPQVTQAQAFLRKYQAEISKQEQLFINLQTQITSQIHAYNTKRVAQLVSELSLLDKENTAFKQETEDLGKDLVSLSKEASKNKQELDKAELETLEESRTQGSVYGSFANSLTHSSSSALSTLNAEITRLKQEQSLLQGQAKKLSKKFASLKSTINEADQTNTILKRSDDFLESVPKQLSGQETSLLKSALQKAKASQAEQQRKLAEQDSTMQQIKTALEMGPERTVGKIVKDLFTKLQSHVADPSLSYEGFLFELKAFKDTGWEGLNLLLQDSAFMRYLRSIDKNKELYKDLIAYKDLIGYLEAVYRDNSAVESDPVSETKKTRSTKVKLNQTQLKFLQDKLIELDAEVTKILVDKPLTSFIILNPPVKNKDNKNQTVSMSSSFNVDENYYAPPDSPPGSTVKTDTSVVPLDQAVQPTMPDYGVQILHVDGVDALEKLVSGPQREHFLDTLAQQIAAQQQLGFDSKDEKQIRTHLATLFPVSNSSHMTLDAYAEQIDVQTLWRREDTVHFLARMITEPFVANLYQDLGFDPGLLARLFGQTNGPDKQNMQAVLQNIVQQAAITVIHDNPSGLPAGGERFVEDAALYINTLVKNGKLAQQLNDVLTSVNIGQALRQRSTSGTNRYTSGQLPQLQWPSRCAQFKAYYSQTFQDFVEKNLQTASNFIGEKLKAVSMSDLINTGNIRTLLIKAGLIAGGGMTGVVAVTVTDTVITGAEKASNAWIEFEDSVDAALEKVTDRTKREELKAHIITYFKTLVGKEDDDSVKKLRAESKQVRQQQGGTGTLGTDALQKALQRSLGVMTAPAPGKTLSSGKSEQKVTTADAQIAQANRQRIKDDFDVASRSRKFVQSTGGITSSTDITVVTRAQAKQGIAECMRVVMKQQQKQGIDTAASPVHPQHAPGGHIGAFFASGTERDSKIIHALSDDKHVGTEKIMQHFFDHAARIYLGQEGDFSHYKHTIPALDFVNKLGTGKRREAFKTLFLEQISEYNLNKLGSFDQYLAKFSDHMKIFIEAVKKGGVVVTGTFSKDLNQHREPKVAAALAFLVGKVLLEKQYDKNPIPEKEFARMMQCISEHFDTNKHSYTDKTSSETAVYPVYMKCFQKNHQPMSEKLSNFVQS